MFGKLKIKYLRSGFIIFFIILFTTIAFKFLLFTSYINSHKKHFRNHIIEHGNQKVFVLKIALHDLLIDKPGFDWKELGNELVINNIYHEVLKIQKNEDHALISLIEDSNENDLFNKYFRLNKNMQNEYSDLMKLLLDFYYIRQEISYRIKSYLVNNETISRDVMFIESDYLNKLIKPPQKFAI